MTAIEKMDKYRVESSSVYEYSKKQGAYVFIGKLNGKTLKQFIAEYEYEQGIK